MKHSNGAVADLPGWCFSGLEAITSTRGWHILDAFAESHVLCHLQQQLPHHQQKVSLRMGIALLDSTHLLETVQEVYFTSECKLKIMFKLQVNTQWLSSLHMLYISGQLYLLPPERESLPLYHRILSDNRETMTMEDCLSYRMYTLEPFKCSATFHN
jgi:hypothetical protein